MFKLIRKTDATIRHISPSKLAINYITKEITPNVSFAVTQADDYTEELEAKYDRIYYVLEGELTVVSENEELCLKTEDACFISQGTKYVMKGTFKAIVVNQPAFGT